MSNFPSYYPNLYQQPSIYYPLYQTDQMLVQRVTELEKQCANLNYQIADLKEIINTLINPSNQSNYVSEMKE